MQVNKFVLFALTSHISRDTYSKQLMRVHIKKLNNINIKELNNLKRPFFGILLQFNRSLDLILVQAGLEFPVFSII